MLPNKHFAKYQIAEWFIAEKSCGMHYTRACMPKSSMSVGKKFYNEIVEILAYKLRLVAFSSQRKSNGE